MSIKLNKFIPENSTILINKWIDQLDISLKFVKSRKTKLGDFRYDIKSGFQITINDDLNPFSTLITLTHEIAHAFTYESFGNRVKPHGEEWKKTYKSLMINFLTIDVFPEDILSSLSHYLINPLASTSNDINLSLSLRKYDQIQPLTIDEINYGEKFIFSNRIFVKKKKLRKRIKCLDVKNQKFYLFNPISKISLIN